MRSFVSPRLQRSAAYLALLSLLTTASQAIDYYKANNTTAPTSAASWWLDSAGTQPATTAPINSTSPAADSCIWNNIVTGPQLIDFTNVGLHTIRILNPGGPITLRGNGQTLTTGAANGGIDMDEATQDLTLLSCSFRIPASGNIIPMQVAAGRTLTFGAGAAITVRNNSGNTTLNLNTDGVSSGTITFAANVFSAHLVIGAGHVELNNPTGNSKNNASNSSTTIGGGTLPARLLINNTSGSATGLPNPAATPTPITSVVTINANGTLGGNGATASAVTANAGSIISPGTSTVNNGRGTLSLADLTLNPDSTIIFEANSPAEADLIIATGSGLTVNGGTVFLYNPGTTNPLTGLGTFNLINSSVVGGTGTLTIAESTKISGRNYILSQGANGITLTISAGTITERSWDVDASGDWSDVTNWTADTIPDGVGTIAHITGSAGATFTAPRTVTLDSARTVGGLDLDSALAVTLASSPGGASLTLDNDQAAATIDAVGADHVVSAPLVLTSGGMLATVDSSLLTFSGQISGLGLGIVKTGAGTLLLTADNTYTGATSVAGTLQVGNGGTTGAVVGPITNNGTVRFSRSDNTTLSQPISGSGGVAFIGSGVTTLAAANTYAGPTTLSAGALVLADPLALQNSTLTYSQSGGTLTVADADADPAPSSPITAITLGGLGGDRPFPLSTVGGTPLSLTVGQNNASTTYSASPIGTGVTFTKLGVGTLTLTGSHAYTGNALVTAGVLSLNAGSNFSAAAASTGSGSTSKILVNGGTLTATAESTVTNASVGLEVAAGTATFSGGIITDNSDLAEGFILVTGGTLNAASIRLGRGSNSSETEPATGQTSQGLYVNGNEAVVNISNALNIGTTANSVVSTRIDAGALTVGGLATVAINNTNRWSVLDINGGTFTATGVASGVQLGGTNVGNTIMHVRGTGVASVEGINFGQAALAGRSYVSLSGNGALYVGSGGLVRVSSAPAPVDPANVNVAGGEFGAAIRLNGGILGATADWSSTIPVSITGLPAVVTGSSASNTPHIITLHGATSGLGSLTKTGAGTVLFTSPSGNFQGPTVVESGTLGLSGQTVDTLTVNAGARFVALGAFTSTDRDIDIQGTLAISYSTAGSTSTVGRVETIYNQPGDHISSITLGANATLELSGSGIINPGTYVIAKAPVINGSFAPANVNLPAGVTLNQAYDDDANPATLPAIAIVVTNMASPYDTWAASYSLAGADAETSADPDADGMNNLLEYALDTDPTLGDPASAYTVARNGSNRLTLTFDHAGDSSLTYVVEATNDLAASPWPESTTLPAFTTEGTYTHTDTADLATNPRRFLRLKVTKAP